MARSSNHTRNATSDANIELPSAPSADNDKPRHDHEHRAEPLTAQDRADIIQTVIGSQAYAGIYLSYDDVARILDEVLKEPVPDIG